MIMYRTMGRYTITEHEVVSQTDKYVLMVVNEKRQRREAKTSSWQNWHKTREHALEFLREGILTEIEFHKNQIECLNIELSKVK